MKIKNGLCFLLLISMISCKKNANICNAIANSKLTATTSVTIGDDIRVSAPNLGPDFMYTWHGPAGFNSPNPADSFSYCAPKNEGWYYLLIVSPDGSCQKYDSIYVTVNFPQGSPACSITADNVIYNNNPTDIFPSITREIDTDFSELALTGSTNDATITVYFHPNWRTIEPEDGIYNTVQEPYDPLDQNYNEVSIAITTNGFNWENQEGQKVYISHIGSKLQVQFCDLTLFDVNGSGITTTASSNLVEQ